MKFGLKHWGHFTILGIAVLAVYFPALATFFAQDDFTHLHMSQVESVQDWLNFFMPRADTIFYRPISVQMYTWLSRLMFGLKPMGYHAIALGMHVAAIYVVYKLLRIWLKPKLSWLGALIYGVHPAQFMSLFWVAEFSLVAAPLFAFLAIWQWLQQKYKWFYLWFILGLLSNELVVMLPVILVWLKMERRNWLRLLPAFGLSGLLILLRFGIKPTSLGSEYVLSFNPGVWWNNLRWYGFRAVGLPEAWRAYMATPQIKRALIGLLGFWLIMATRIRPNWKMLGLGLGWFGIALVPVLLLARHQSPIYAIIGLPGFILSLVSMVKIPHKLWLVAGGWWLVASFWSVRAQAEYHWVTKRARLAKYHLEKLQLHAPQPGETVVFLNTTPDSSTQVYLALGGENAVKIWFGEEVAVVFEDMAGATTAPRPVYVLSRLER